MTTTELKAGRELDALIAERVMGLLPVSILPGMSVQVTMFVEPGHSRDRAIHPAPYSTDIAAAWEVLNRFKCGWSSRLAGREYSVCVWQNNVVGYVAESESFTEAVCLAALKAVQS